MSKIKKFEFKTVDGKLNWVLPNKDRPELRTFGDHGMMSAGIVVLAEKLNEVIDKFNDLTEFRKMYG